MWYHDLDLIILMHQFQLGIFHDSMWWRRIHRIIIVGRDFKDHCSRSGGVGGGGGGGGEIFFTPVVA